MRIDENSHQNETRPKTKRQGDGGDRIVSDNGSGTRDTEQSLGVLLSRSVIMTSAFPCLWRCHWWLLASLTQQLVSGGMV